MTDSFDVIIVGAGAAGCVLADRLSADPARRVLLLEAGGRDLSPLYSIPLGIGRLRTRRHNNWAYRTEPEPGLQDRSLFLHQGKVIGGSSSLNGMVYVRPPAVDFERWGVPGWSHAEMLPYLLRAEGTLSVRVRPSPFPLDHAFVAAGREAGFALAGDFDRPDREGFGFFAFNIRGGRRATSAASFLRPARARPNLTVLTRAHAARIAIERGRATGVDYAHRGRPGRAAAGEIVLCAGAINSPQLLLLSGLGDAAALQALGIAVVADHPAVGRDLQNHVDVGVRQACTRPVALYSLMRADRIGRAMAAAWLFGTGPATTFPGEAGAYVRSRDAAATPDVQLHLVSMLAPHQVRWRPAHGPLDRDGFSCRAILLRPESRGSVTLRAADPFAAPRLRFNYLTRGADLDTLRRGVRIIREVLAQPALADLRGPELEPGPGIADDAALESWIRAKADTQGHPAGTCRMGGDADSVVDPDLRVRGVAGLRVADASIMPAIVGANTYATAVMIAEKAADLILGKAPPSPAPSAGSAATGSAPARS